MARFTLELTARILPSGVYYRGSMFDDCDWRVKKSREEEEAAVAEATTDLARLLAEIASKYPTTSMLVVVGAEEKPQ